MSLGKNILWNIGGFVWLTFLLIFATPYMVHQMGMDAFGVWSVLAAFSGYLSTMDFGLGNALIRFLAAEGASKNPRTFEAFIRSGITLQLLQGGLGGLVLFVAGPALAARWFHIPPGMGEETTVAFRLTGCSVLLGFLAAGYAAVPAAMGRFDLLTVRTFVLLSLQYGLFLLVLHAGGGLREMVAVNLLAAVVLLVYLLVVTHHLCPGLNLLPGWNKVAGREFFRFGRFKFAGQLFWTFLREFDRIAIALLLPIGRVPFYAVPLRLSQRISQVIEQIATPFYPAMTSQITSGRDERLHYQYRIGSRLVAAVSLGFAAILAGLAEPLLTVWLGTDFARESVPVLRILLLAYTASAMFTLPSVAADGAGQPWINALFLGIGALIHVPLVIFGIRQWGLAGAALGVLAGFLVPLFGIKIIHARVPALPSLSNTILDTRGSVAAATLTLVAGLLAARTSFPNSGFLPLILTAGGTLALYLLLLFLLRAVRHEDVRRLTAAFQRT